MSESKVKLENRVKYLEKYNNKIEDYLLGAITEIKKDLESNLLNEVDDVLEYINDIQDNWDMVKLSICDKIKQ
jgi:hypothetical protein